METTPARPAIVCSFSDGQVETALGEFAARYGSRSAQPIAAIADLSVAEFGTAMQLAADAGRAWATRLAFATGPVEERERALAAMRDFLLAALGGTPIGGIARPSAHYCPGDEGGYYMGAKEVNVLRRELRVLRASRDQPGNGAPASAREPAGHDSERDDGRYDGGGGGGGPRYRGRRGGRRSRKRRRDDDAARDRSGSPPHRRRRRTDSRSPAALSRAVHGALRSPRSHPALRHCAQTERHTDPFAPQPTRSGGNAEPVDRLAAIERRLCEVERRLGVGSSAASMGRRDALPSPSSVGGGGSVFAFSSSGPALPLPESLPVAAAHASVPPPTADAQLGALLSDDPAAVRGVGTETPVVDPSPGNRRGDETSLPK